MDILTGIFVTAGGPLPSYRRYRVKRRLSLRESSATFAERKATGFWSRVASGLFSAAVAMILLTAPPPPLAAQALAAAAAEEDGSAARPSAPSGASPAPTPLKPQSLAPRGGTSRAAGGLESLLTVGGSLAVVLAGFLVIAWALRRASPGGFRVLPAEAFEVLGRAPLANRQQAHLVRCGNKLLLVAVSTEGAETLTEITDSAEVERLAAACRRVRPNGSALGQVFRRGEKHDA